MVTTLAYSKNQGIQGTSIDHYKINFLEPNTTYEVFIKQCIELNTGDKSHRLTSQNKYANFESLQE